MQEQVKDATIFGGIYLDRYGREKPLLQKPCNKCYEVKNKKLHEQGVIKSQISVFMEMVSEKGTIKTTCPKWSSTCPKWSA